MNLVIPATGCHLSEVYMIVRTVCEIPGVWPGHRDARAANIEDS